MHLNGHKKLVYLLNELSDGKLISASEDNTVKIWNVEKKSCIYTMRNDNILTVSCMFSLKNKDINVLSIYGSLDGVSTPTEINKGKQYLPSNTIYEELKGGNHSNFGLYKLQKGDNVSTISKNIQQNKTINMIEINFNKWNKQT